MIKTIKKVVLGSLSVLGVSTVCWVLLLLNPQWSYAKETQYDFVTIYHNQVLKAETETVVNNAIEIIQQASIYTDDLAIELCLNDGSAYPKMSPLGGGSAYAMLNKTIINDCTIDFAKNIAETQWAINNNERRRFNLTWLLAHEFTHNLQYHTNSKYVITSTLGKLNWKLEGHAEYIAREFKNDGKLKEKLALFLEEEDKKREGLPVLDLDDGTKQIFSYLKYALAVQYLIEEEGLDYIQICADERDLDQIFGELKEWGLI